MNSQNSKKKLKEWLRRYIPGEILGTIIAVTAAGLVFGHSHSYLAAAAAGWTGEGIGFYGYFIVTELLLGARQHQQYTWLKRLSFALATASKNLLVEFVPAEIIDNILVRPFAMYVVPQHVHPYIFGFLVGKFSADLAFYVIAICGYETRKHWHCRLTTKR